MINTGPRDQKFPSVLLKMLGNVSAGEFTHFLHLSLTAQQLLLVEVIILILSVVFAISSHLLLVPHLTARFLDWKIHSLNSVQGGMQKSGASSLSTEVEEAMS